MTDQPNIVVSGDLFLALSDIASTGLRVAAKAARQEGSAAFALASNGDLLFHGIALPLTAMKWIDHNDLIPILMDISDCASDWINEIDVPQEEVA